MRNIRIIGLKVCLLVASFYIGITGCGSTKQHITNTQNEKNIISANAAIDEADLIEYRYVGSSTAPGYQRNYTIKATKTKAMAVVRSYEDTISNTTIDITPEQFLAVKRVAKNSALGKRKTSKDNKGCTGGTTDALKLYNKGDNIFEAYVYHCQGDYGDLTGDVSAVKKELTDLFPNFGSLLKK